ncbi:GNAT family N-acetyltransferase [Rhodobacteraceae bacterium 63075]|nr:GNAT family N-acetyltransferase [Rhodobacteraceae bacterium 63075]
MTSPDIQALYAVLEATWPAAHMTKLGPWTIREGQGGGQRVSATTTREPIKADALAAEIARAEAAMDALGQPRLFMIREGERELDDALQARGYAVHDPVIAYIAPVAQLASERPPRVTALLAWEPLAIMLDIWEAGGIGPGRVAVMHRACEPKTGLIGRLNDHPAAAGFCAIHAGTAMIHALEVLPHQRNQKMGRYAVREFAHWAEQNGASHISLMVTKANAPACALYSSLGMSIVGEYHYRLEKEG